MQTNEGISFSKEKWKKSSFFSCSYRGEYERFEMDPQRASRMLTSGIRGKIPIIIVCLRL
jgi:hypothetical protein